MNIFVLCATNRGLTFLERLFALCPPDDFFVFSFPKEPWEPRYLDEHHMLCARHGASFFETRNVAHERSQSLWDTIPVDLIFVVSWRYLIQRGSVPGFRFLASVIAIFSGAQLFALGIIGEYLARVHFRTMGRPVYSVRERTSNE